MNVPIQKLRPGAKIPTRGSQQAAGYDLYACLEQDTLTIPAHETGKIPTGIALAIPQGYFGAMFARSGLATKQGLRPANCVGVVDSDYRGECLIFLHNDSDQPRCIANGDRVAQLVLLPYLSAEFQETDTLEETLRGAGGFGSTGK